MKLKRTIALFLALLMMFSMLPTSVFADEDAASEEPQLQVSTQEMAGGNFNQVTILDGNDAKKQDFFIKAGKPFDLPRDVFAEDAELVGWEVDGMDVGAPGKKFTPQGNVVLRPLFRMKELGNNTDLGYVSLDAYDGIVGFGRGYLPKGAVTGSFDDASSYNTLASEAVPAGEGMATRAVTAFTLGLSNQHGKFDGKDFTVRIDLKEGIELKEGETLTLVKVGTTAKVLKCDFTPASGSPLTALSFTDTELGTYVIVGTSKKEAVTYTVTFVADEKTVATLEVAEGEAIGENLPEAPEKAGYDFVGWFIETEGVETKLPSDSVIITSDTTATAHFEAIAGQPVENGTATGSASGITATVTDAGGVLPEGTEFVVAPADDSIVTAALAGIPYDSYAAVDLSFYNGDERLSSLAGPVNISVGGLNMDSSKTISVYHITSDGKAELVYTQEPAVAESASGTETKLRMTAPKAASTAGTAIGNVTFSASSFSIYVVVETGEDARLTVNFHRADGTTDTMQINKRQLDKIEQYIFDPGAGTPEGAFFKGWTTVENYTAETTPVL